jgi:predicted lysophospholipase L1 biosynthesis ABC-type transport system permease subunit
MVAGRPFVPGDDQAGAHVAIISETMARRYFGGESAIGHRVNGLDVVGVARDTKYTSLRDPAQPMLYTPVIGGWIVADVRFVIHSQRDPAQLTADIRRAVKETGAGRELTGIQSINEIAESTLARERLLAELATSFGALALVLACIGLYGTMSYAVTRRTNEIGIRMALGATREGVVSQLMRESAATVAPGLVIGAVGAFAVSRMLSRLLFGLGAGDPITIGVAVVVLAPSAAVAAYLPARRASGADPLAALRAD